MRKSIVFAVAALFFMPVAVQAGSFPDKNVNIILGAGPGGPTDLTVRALVDNIPAGIVPSGVAITLTHMPGGSGLVAANRVLSSPKDGYTLGIINIDLVNSIVKKVTPITLDQYVPLVFTQADPYLVLVGKNSPYKTLKDMVEYIKANPGKVLFGDSGPAAAPHLAIVGMAKALGLDIPTNGYESNLASAVAVLNGECQATVAHASSVIGYLESGDLIPIAVTSPERLSLFPDVPGMGELYPEMKELRVLSAVCVAGMAGAPQESIDFLRDAFLKSISTDKFKESLKALQSAPITITTPQQFDTFFAGQLTFLGTLL